MHGRSSRLSGSGVGSRSIGLVLAMAATIATVYVAGRLWQESENRLHLTQDLNKRTTQGLSSISVEDTLKIMGCREQQKKLSTLEMDLAEARKMGFVTTSLNDKGIAHSKKRLLAAIGVVTTFGHRKNRDAVRKTWMHSELTQSCNTYRKGPKKIGG